MNQDMRMNRNRLYTPVRVCSRNRRGLSFVELMVAVAVFSLVSIFVAIVTLEVARQSKESLSQIPAQEQAYRAVDFIRQKVLPATFNSLSVAADGSYIQFRDPSNANESRLTFDANNDNLIYDPDVTASNDEFVWGRNIKGQFSTGTGFTRNVSVTVTATAYNRFNEAVIISYQDDLRVRN